MKQAPDNLAKRHQSLLWWRHLWTTLVFTVGLATTIFVISAILLLINESWVPGAVSSVASILSGGSVGWLLARRREAVSEEEQALSDLRTATDKAAATDKRQQSRIGMFGRKNSPPN